MSARTGTVEMLGANDGKERFFVGWGGPYVDAGNGRFAIWRRPNRSVEEVESTTSVGKMMDWMTMAGSGGCQRSVE